MADTETNSTMWATGDAALVIAKALASEIRQTMLRVLADGTLNISELAERMQLPHSTVSFHLNQLSAAGLITFETDQGSRGSQKLCTRLYDEVHLRLPGAAGKPIADLDEESVTVVSMPIGSYRYLQALPSCGLASESKLIGLLDDPRSFFDPDHINAQILWFREGRVEYAFPNSVPYGSVATSIELSMELCSEAPGFAMDWPSDITLWLNDVEIGTWTSPGDFGGKAAAMTPKWWPVDQTTHGLLKRWRVDAHGAMIDGSRLSRITLTDLSLESANFLKVSLGIKPDARNRGGLNLFGRKFGNYPQDIVMRTWHRADRTKAYTYPPSAQIAE
jgi:predicted transcriptional regulator